jgi:hypothetical protein
VSERRLRYLVVALLPIVAVGCAGKITTQQALVQEAFETCRAQGPSTTLDRVERDGRFTVVGREGEAQRVHDCMIRFGEPARREPARRESTGAAVPSAPAPKPEALVAGRLPGTWRGTLKMPARAVGQAETASPATMRFAVAAGTLRWTLATGAASPALTADGTAMVVDGELRMTGTVRTAAAAAPSTEPRPTVSVRYAGTMVGDRLEVTGVTTDKQVHALSLRRTAE